MFKNPFQSATLIGAIIALLSRFLNAEMSANEGAGLVHESTALWPVLVGIFADLKVALSRIQATQFNVTFYKSQVFWAGLVAAAMSVMQLLGVDWTGLEDLPNKIAAAIGGIGAIVGSIMVFVGRARASKQILLP